MGIRGKEGRWELKRWDPKKCILTAKNDCLLMFPLAQIDTTTHSQHLSLLHMGIQLLSYAQRQVAVKSVWQDWNRANKPLPSLVAECVCVQYVCMCVHMLFRHGSPLLGQWEIFMRLKAWLPWKHNEMLIEWRPVWFASLLIPLSDRLGPKLMLIELTQWKLFCASTAPSHHAL